MGEFSKIEWTNSTFNAWIGCTKIAPACDACYAADLARFHKWTVPADDKNWAVERKRTAASTWKRPLKWNREATAFDLQHGHRQRVFCSSLSDWLDNQVPIEWLKDLLDLIDACPNLDWLMLTKRPQNLAKRVGFDWLEKHRNIWLGVTTENQAQFDKLWPFVAEAPAVVRFISYEPALGPLNIRPDLGDRMDRGIVPDWVIFGGESGPHARTGDPFWARAMQRQCADLGIAYFHKQWGHYGNNPIFLDGFSRSHAEVADPKTNGKGGGLLDGKLFREFPHPRPKALAAL